MSKVTFETSISDINGWLIVVLPDEISKALPSRGMVMVEGTLNELPIKTVLEPTGQWSHWFRIPDDLAAKNGLGAGKRVSVELGVTKDWIRPEVPADLQKALNQAPDAQKLWDDITPSAQWEWVRWIRATKQAETRAKHVDVAISKLNHGSRRPCCINRNLCSVPEVSHNWMLRQPSE